MPTVTKEEQIRADTARLHQMGYAQQLFRDMGGFSNFAISFTIISVLTGGLTLYSYGLNHGGPQQMAAFDGHAPTLYLPRRRDQAGEHAM